MNINKLQQDLTNDEGVKYEVYLDHLGLFTCGIGHLILESDEEYGQPVGTTVSGTRVNELFESDVGKVLSECTRLYDNFYLLPEEVQLIIANMMFNLGYPRLSKFVGMRKAVEAKDWNLAADEMIDSRWYNQVNNRAQRLVDRMRAVVSA